MKLTAIAIALILAGCASTPPKEMPLTAAEARAEEMKAFALAMGSAKDAETQRLLIFAQYAGKGNQAPIVVDHGNRTVGDAVFNFLDRTTERLFSVAPAYFGYKGSVRASESSERMNETNSRVSIANSNNFLALGVAGIQGASAVATSFANSPRPVPIPTTQITFGGTSGNVNIGSGTQTNSSNNPVTNPAPVVCSGSPVTCSR